MSNDWGGWEDNSQWAQPPQHDYGHTPQQQQHYGYSDHGQHSSYNQQHQQHQQQQPSHNPYGYGGQQQQSSSPYPDLGAQAFGNFGGAQQFMADPMLKAAQQFGGQFAEQQKEKITKYITGFNLKYYFAVDHSYVGKKLGILLFPFFRSEWATKFTGNDQPAPAREDVNAPDLYIPLMAFLTYVLLSGFVVGTQGRFSPEVLGILTSNAFIWLILENIVIFVSKYVMNISQSMSVWHSLAYSTYKFVGMIICLVMFLAGGKTFYYCALAYTAAALSFFLLRTVKNFVFDSNHFSGDDGRKRKLILILFILFSQPLIMWWLTSGATNFDYGKYDFARLAMSKIGISPGGGADVPMTDDGEVDYEALLKMPK